MTIDIKSFILKIPYFLNIILHLHSKSPNKEIRKIWEIFAISGFPVALLTIFSGVKILVFIPTLKIDFINNNGAWIFFIFVVVFCIVFFDTKKAKEISVECKKHSNP